MGVPEDTGATRSRTFYTHFLPENAYTVRRRPVPRRMDKRTKVFIRNVRFLSNRKMGKRMREEKAV